jgi:hypothetical protein
VNAAQARPRYALVALLLVPLGVATKLYHGPGGSWVEGNAGGLLYVVFWILLVMAARPSLRPARVAAAVLLLTCLLELLQLWHPAWLEPIRAGFIGHALLGNTFAWLDFPHYLAGALAGWALSLWIRARTGLRPHPRGLRSARS